MTEEKTLVLRPASVDDAKALRERCWPQRTEQAVAIRLASIARRRRQKLAWGLVAVAGGEVVGYGQVSRWQDGGEISDLIVAPEWREQGIGTMLVRTLAEIAHSEGFPEVEIGAAHSNPRAMALYERLGFEPRRTVQMDFGQGPEPVTYLVMRFDTPQDDA